MSNEQKVAIVTGASQGIGAAIVRGYRDAGYVVIANSRSITQGSDQGVIAVPGNIADPDIASQLVQTAIDRFGRVDTLVNNAGIFIGKPFTEYTMEDFHRVIDVNLGGFFHITQRVLDQMLRTNSGHIVQVTAAVVKQPIAGVPSGLAGLTKGGLDAITRSLAIEYAEKGIRVNAVAPGIIKTPMHAVETHDFLDKLHPLGRMGEAQEVADAVLYLERAAFVTGETLHVDGGQHAGR